MRYSMNAPFCLTTTLECGVSLPRSLRLGPKQVCSHTMLTFYLNEPIVDFIDTVGSPVKTTVKGLRKQCVPCESACTLARYHVEGKLVGYAFATRWPYRKLKGIFIATHYKLW